MKTHLTTTLNVETLNELRERAASTGLALNEMLELSARYMLGKLTDDALRAWKAKQTSTRGRLGGALTKDENTVLAAMSHLTEKDGTFRHGADEIADGAALRRAVAYGVLKKLQLRGLVGGMEMSKEFDRWGRPLNSVFWLMSDFEKWEAARLAKLADSKRTEVTK